MDLLDLEKELIFERKNNLINKLDLYKKIIFHIERINKLCNVYKHFIKTLDN